MGLHVRKVAQNPCRLRPKTRLILYRQFLAYTLRCLLLLGGLLDAPFLVDQRRQPSCTRCCVHLLVVRSLWRGYQRHLSRRAMTAALRQMDDHLLRDIGLSRGDIEAAIRDARPRL